MKIAQLRAGSVPARPHRRAAATTLRALSIRSTMFFDVEDDLPARSAREETVGFCRLGQGQSCRDARRDGIARQQGYEHGEVLTEAVGVRGHVGGG